MSITTAQLENESRAKVLRQHSCVENKMPELLRVCLVSFETMENKEVWEIFSIWIATEADVNGGEADEVGELLNLSSITISYCPFCGVNLDQP